MEILSFRYSQIELKTHNTGKARGTTTNYDPWNVRTAALNERVLNNAVEITVLPQ
jgi:hypothetical protein